MSRSRQLMGVASIAGLLFASALPASAQQRIAIPNSATRINCAPSGTASVTTADNQDESPDASVVGTPVTALDPSGYGTTESETPLLTKPSTVVMVQCPHSALRSANVSKSAPNKARAKMNALSNNPNGALWLNKYSTRAKMLTGGGG